MASLEPILLKILEWGKRHHRLAQSLGRASNSDTVSIYSFKE